ncbi:MAG: hypothetical protein HC767_08675 [Akkermansiaceae bacterium]|nr:hypothetical protein [Akkermansiaceae bacterium]
MMKTSATAMLAVATLAGSATAQDTCGSVYEHCVGPDEGDNGPCCAPLICVQKNVQYAQCLEPDEPIPLTWMGNILTYSEDVGGPVVGDAGLDEDDDFVALAPGSATVLMSWEWNLQLLET